MPKIKRTKEIQSAIDELAKGVWGKSQTDCIAAQICVCCHKPAKEFKDNISAKEYRISGLCQICQDEIW